MPRIPVPVLVLLVLLVACGSDPNQTTTSTASTTAATTADGACFDHDLVRLERCADVTAPAYAVQTDSSGRITALTLTGMDLAACLQRLDSQGRHCVGLEQLPAGRFALHLKCPPVEPEALFTAFRQGLEEAFALEIDLTTSTRTSAVLTCPELHPPFSRGLPGGSAILATPTTVQFINVNAQELAAWLGKRLGMVIPVELPVDCITGSLSRTEEPAVLLSLFEKAGFTMTQQVQTTETLVIRPRPKP